MKKQKEEKPKYNIFTSREEIKDFEKEYNAFIPKQQPYKYEYFLESKKAVRINKARPYDIIIHSIEIYEKIKAMFRALDNLKSYRKSSEAKRLEAEEELDINKIPFN
jgi:hypothetical protein